RLAEVVRGHRRALEVPARTARAPRALPRRLARLGALPEREVVRILLARIVLLAGLHVLEAAMGELPVGGEAADTEVHAAVGDRVREPLRDQLLDERDHQADVLRRARLVGRREAAQPADVVVE